MDFEEDVPTTPNVGGGRVPEDKFPIPWGITRLVVAVASLFAGMTGAFLFVLSSIRRIPLQDALGGPLSIMGLIAIVVILLLSVVGLVQHSIGPFGFREFCRAVYDRNWLRYRIEYWPIPNNEIKWKVSRLSAPVWRPLSGEESFAKFVVWSALSARGKWASIYWFDSSGVSAPLIGLWVSRPKEPDGTRDANHVMLRDGEKTTIRVPFSHAMRWWIPWAASFTNPSLSGAATATLARMDSFLRRAERVELSFHNQQLALEHVETDCKSMRQRFEMQRILALLAVRVIRDAIWKIYHTRRLDGVRVNSAEGATIREWLTDCYRMLSRQEGASEHEFLLPSLPPSPKGQRNRSAAV